MVQTLRLYDPASIDLERDAYRLAILLSVITSVHTLLDLVEGHFTTSSTSTTVITSSPRRPPSPLDVGGMAHAHRLRRLRLAPILALEPRLRTRLGVVSTSAHMQASASRITFAAHAWGNQASADHADVEWHVLPTRWPAGPFPDRHHHDAQDQVQAPPLSPTHDPSHLLAATRDEILGLFTQAIDLGLIAGQGRHADVDDQPDDDDEDDAAAAAAAAYDLGHGATFFLTSFDRIVAPRYLPTDDDLLHVRIATLGIEEHVVNVAPGHWYRVLDPAGARGRRHKWAAFFEDAGAIVFVVDAAEFDVNLFLISLYSRILSGMTDIHLSDDGHGEN